MKEQPSKKENEAKVNPEDIIMAIRQEALGIGGNKFEPSAFDEILRRLHDSEISQTEAIEQARAILGSKPDQY